MPAGKDVQRATDRWRDDPSVVRTTACNSRLSRTINPFPLFHLVHLFLLPVHLFRLLVHLFRLLAPLFLLLAPLFLLLAPLFLLLVPHRHLPALHRHPPLQPPLLQRFPHLQVGGPELQVLRWPGVSLEGVLEEG